MGPCIPSDIVRVDCENAAETVSWKKAQSNSEGWEINVFGQILRFSVFTPYRLSAWWKRSREMVSAPVPLSECLRSPLPHKCAP